MMYRPWDELQRALSRVDWARLEPMLHQSFKDQVYGLDPRLQATRDAAMRALGPEIRAWMDSGGPTLGDERFRGWCWCCSFRRAVEQSRQDPSGATASIVEELKMLFRWYERLDAHLQALQARYTPDSVEDEIAVARIIHDAVRFVVDQGIHDAWYSLVEPVVYWSLQRLGWELPDAELERVVEAQLELHFTSWSTPSGQTMASFSEQVAFALVLARFEQLYPEA